MLLYSKLDHLRDLSAVLLRRLLLLDDETVWGKMAEATRAMLKGALLQVVETNVVRSTRRNVCNTVADLAIGTLVDEQPWPELFGKLDAWARSTAYDLREYALYIFELMSHYFVMVGYAALSCVRVHV